MAPERAGGNAPPLVVLSHGSGGAAVNLMWLAEALAADWFLVAAVDHHRDSSTEQLLPEGAPVRAHALLEVRPFLRAYLPG